MIKSHIEPDYIYIHSFTPSDHKRVGYNRLQMTILFIRGSQRILNPLRMLFVQLYTNVTLSENSCTKKLPRCTNIQTGGRQTNS